MTNFYIDIDDKMILVYSDKTDLFTCKDKQALKIFMIEALETNDCVFVDEPVPNNFGRYLIALKAASMINAEDFRVTPVKFPFNAQNPITDKKFENYCKAQNIIFNEYENAKIDHVLKI